MEKKKQRLATDNISFAFSCELPALCEHSTDTGGREYPLFPFLGLTPERLPTVAAPPQAKK